VGKVQAKGLCLQAPNIIQIPDRRMRKTEARSRTQKIGASPRTRTETRELQFLWARKMLEICANTPRASELRETHRKRPKRWICAKIFCIRSRTPWKRRRPSRSRSRGRRRRRQHQEPRELGEPKRNWINILQRAREGTGGVGVGAQSFLRTLALRQQQRSENQTKRTQNNDENENENFSQPSPPPPPPHPPSGEHRPAREASAARELLKTCAVPGCVCQTESDGEQRKTESGDKATKSVGKKFAKSNLAVEACVTVCVLYLHLCTQALARVHLARVCVRVARLIWAAVDARVSATAALRRVPLQLRLCCPFSAAPSECWRVGVGRGRVWPAGGLVEPFPRADPSAGRMALWFLLAAARESVTIWKLAELRSG